MNLARILVATDLSETADEALRQGGAWAAAANAKLGVCHVAPSLVGIHPLFPQLNAQAVQADAEFEARLRTGVADRTAEILGEQEAHIFIERGLDHVEIVRCAERWHADLVVVASRGRSGLPRVLLGSVAENVVRHVHCPVLVARKTAPSGVVLVATDLSDPSLPAVELGVAEAKRRKARLVVVHALDFGTPMLTATLAAPFVAAPPMLTSEAQREMREGVEAMLKVAVGRFDATAELRVLDGPAAPAVVRCAETLGAELLVIATHGRTGFMRLTLGSTAERIIRAAGCSVLVARLHG